MAGDVEMIALEQVEDRDSPLLLDVGVAPQDRALVELDVDDPGVGHERLLAGAAFLRQPPVIPAKLDLMVCRLALRRFGSPCTRSGFAG